MKTLDRLWERGQQFLGTRFAILGGAMTWVSDAHLVSAISNGGGFGVLASGAMDPVLLQQAIIQTQSLTSQPFGVNLITMNPYLFDLMDVCGQYNVSHVVLAGGMPSKTMIQHLKSLNCRVIAMAPTEKLAMHLVRFGVDALIVEGHEAGGHVGPIATSVLAQDVLMAVKGHVPVFVAGGIGRGEMIGAYLKLGAAGCQLGTRFVCTHECQAHENFKEAFIQAQSKDAILSPQLDPMFPVIPVRGLNNEGTQQFLKTQQEAIHDYRQNRCSQKEAQLRIEKFWAGALRRAVQEGDVVHGSVMAGQSVGMIKSIEPCIEILESLTQQACQYVES